MGLRLDELFFTQERVGQNGDLLRVRKFRTMRGDQPQRTMEEIRGRLAGLPGELGRVTLSGALLRHTGVDELPQLLNVCRGEMQVVGIRPVPREEHDLFPPDVAELYDRHKPGLFDVALVMGHPSGELEDKFDRIRGSAGILGDLERLRREGKWGERLVMMIRLMTTIYVRKVTDMSHIRAAIMTLLAG